MKTYAKIIAIFTLCFSLAEGAFAEPVQGPRCISKLMAVFVDDLAKDELVPIGAKVKLLLPGDTQPRNTLFLGKIVNSDGHLRSLAFYDDAKEEVHFLNKAGLELVDANQNPIKPSSLTPVIQSKNQVGETCGAYSLYNCLSQVKNVENMKAHVKGNPLSLVKMNQKRLAHKDLKFIIEAHYKDGENFPTVSGLLRHQDFELKFAANPFASSQEMKDLVLSEAKEGNPVYIIFQVNKRKGQMDTHQAKLISHLKQGKTPDPRIWLPRRPPKWWNFFDKSKTNTYHAVVCLGAFEDSNGSVKLLISDPNWQLPRLWNLEELDNAQSGQIWLYVVRPKPASTP